MNRDENTDTINVITDTKIMTPKDKANKLYRQYFQKVTLKGEFSWSREIAKDCALIAVDEMLNLCWNGNETALQFWEQVKHELKNNEFDI